ncbi:MAG: hypothetical protein ABIZ70_14690 [Gemmatimonadales bacterium]
MRPSLLPWVALASALTIAACAHSTPADDGTLPALTGPLTLSAPVRLTFNDGMDHVASFSDDGTTLLYAFQEKLPLPPVVVSRPDADRCIGVMPAAGGTRQSICRPDLTGLDSTDAFEHATVNAAGALLYAAYSSRIGSLITNGGTLRLASLGAPWPGRALLTTPTVTAGISFDHFGVIRWASPTLFFVEVHDQTLIGNPYNELKLDTLALGLGILRGDLSGSGVVFTAVTGADSANGFDLSAGRDSLYFTRLDDATLYAIPIGGGARSVVYTEPAGGGRRILRDPVRVGTRIAVVRQNYQARLQQLSPPTGLEAGAAIQLVRPSDGTATTLVAASGSASTQGSLAAFGAMAASPDGCRLVVEHRVVEKFSFTTDLYAYCLGLAGQCSCS